MIDWPLVYVIAEWVVRVVMLVVVTQRQQPRNALAWLVAIYFLPWLGLILYVLIGENRLPRRRAHHRAVVEKQLQRLAERFRGHPHIVHPEFAGATMTAVNLAERLGSLPILGKNNAELIDDTDEFIRRLIDDIDAAEQHVHLLYYIFADDATGHRVAEALLRAAGRGVPCRLLVDAVGSRQMLKRLAPRLEAGGVDVHPLLPVSLLRRQAARLDLRNHRKLAVLDGRTAYVGSQNLVNANYGHKDLAWHDLSVRLTGPSVLELQVVFAGDWFSETTQFLNDDKVFPDPRPTGDISVQTLPSGPTYTTENYQRLVVTAIHGAQRRVTITTPYLVPDEPTLQAIEVAVLRGVKVQFIIPERCDQRLVGAASRGYYEMLLDSGVELYLYRDGLLHAKTILIDDTLSMIGSSNFDIRSFEINFELNLMFYGPQMAGKLGAMIDRWIEGSRRLQSDQWNHRPELQRIGQNVARLFSPLL